MQRIFLISTTIIGLHCITGCGGGTKSPAARELQAIEHKLDTVLAHSTKSDSVSPRLEVLNESISIAIQRIESLEKQVVQLQQSLQQSDELMNPGLNHGLEIRLKADAESLFADLGESPTAEQFAQTLATVDEWIVDPEESDSFQLFKRAQVAALRERVQTEVRWLHNEALNADDGTKAVDFHARASKILALYPMDSTPPVLDEARRLSSRHSEVGVRLDVLRRQRYNSWALTRIEETIKAINQIASSFSTSDNAKTIEATVIHLGEVDPVLLEPLISQLYNYAVELAKSNINSEQQLELGRRLVDPSLVRRAFGDF